MAFLLNAILLFRSDILFRWVGCLVVLLIAIIILYPQPSLSYTGPIVAPVVEHTVELFPLPHEPVLSQEDIKQIECMTRNTYFEARNQTQEGQIAVANVVMNRVEDHRFPNTPCEVIYQRTKRTCQFSWVCQRGKVVNDHRTYATIQDLMEKVYAEKFQDVTQGAKFYHAYYVNPRWNLRKVRVIGDHIFYNYKRGL